MLRQPLVDEGVVGRQQIEHVAIVADDAVEEELDLAPHRAAQRVVEVGIHHRQRADAVHAAQVQPLSGEIDRQRFGPPIGEHAPHLSIQHRRILQFAPACEPEQFFVGNGAPQEK